MGSLEKRLNALEEQADREKRRGDPEEEKRHWLLGARRRRREATSEEVRQARSLIGLFRIQHVLPEMSTDELIERIVSWRPVPEGGRSRTTAEREVGLAIYNQEEGTESMVCPPAWRESFEAADELHEKHNAIPEEVLAEAYVRLRQIGEGDEEGLGKWRACYEEGFGISEELVRRAVGPDVDEISEEECIWRLTDYLADTFYGERGWRIHRHMVQLLDGAS
jgi:hypothetical protein